MCPNPTTTLALLHVSCLQDYALEHVMLGDEAAARSALQQKAAVADALRQATRRAETNSALARYVAGDAYM